MAMQLKYQSESHDSAASNHRLGQEMPNKTHFSSWMAKYLSSWIPEAFEDEDGFHFGPKPLAETSKSPRLN
jgi:hypothetical protein